MKFILLVLFLISPLFTGCGPESEYSPDQNTLIGDMEPEEYKNKVINEAFVAVYNNNEAKVKELLKDRYILFTQDDAFGKTPLMVAMENHFYSISLIISEKLTQEDRYYIDHEGRGYLIYAAKAGFIGVIDKIVIKDREDSNLGFMLYDMKDIDKEDKFRRHSLFYAANFAVAQRLFELWTYGVTGLRTDLLKPDFFTQRDDLHQNFLHKAASENRYDVIDWYISKYCPSPAFSDTDALMGLPKLLGDIASYLVPLQNNIKPDYFMHSVNQQDLKGNTPLHTALKNLNKESVKSLQACRYQLYSTQNNEGLNPLSYFLANLSKNKRQYEFPVKEIFNSLYNKKNDRYLTHTNKFYIEQKSNFKQTSLHFAAQLSDPYFYNKLRELSNYNEVNEHNQTPRDIFLEGRRSY